jgi:hypothetical protein
MNVKLRMFAAEVTRVALEVGTQGILGGQAEVAGAEGTWKDLTDNVNVRAIIPKCIPASRQLCSEWLPT